MRRRSCRVVMTTIGWRNDPPAWLAACFNSFQQRAAAGRRRYGFCEGRQPRRQKDKRHQMLLMPSKCAQPVPPLRCRRQESSSNLDDLFITRLISRRRRHAMSGIVTTAQFPQFFAARMREKT